jgi:3-phenylpropionate/trans-cinnamate dioxygenase ferredoxin reductase component
VSVTISAHVTSVHEAHGTRVRHWVRVLALAGDGAGRVAGVELEGGEVLEADLVVLGVGIAPNVELAAQAGLAVDDGVEVDGRLRTSDERIWAIGDLARFPLPDGTRVRLESVQNATDHGRTAAAAILGATEPYTALPWFWSHQHECRLQIAGLCAGHDETVLRGEPASGSFSVFCFEGPRLAAVETVNAPKDHMAARRLLEAGVELTVEQAADPGCDLKALAAGAA